MLLGPPSLLFNGSRNSFLEVKQLWQEVNHSPPSSVKVKNEWSYILIPLICLHGTNRALGQLHSNGDIVSIVHSSARRLLLVYLSAHCLCSSGYYPKYQNGVLSSGFWAGVIKISHKDWDPAKRGAEESQECFFLPKIRWWRLPWDMGRCHGAASKWVQCLVAHVPPFCWVIQGLPDEKALNM